MNKLYIILVLVIALIPAKLFATSLAVCNPTFDDGARQYFAESIPAAKSALEAICESISKQDSFTEQELNDTLMAFHNQIQGQVATLLPDLKNYLDLYDAPLFEEFGNIQTGMMPGIIWVQPGMDPNRVDNIIFYYQRNNWRTDVTTGKEVAQACFDNDSCSETLTAYMSLLEDVYRPLSAQSLRDAFTFLSLKDKEWESFIEESRSQTFVDIAVTSWLYDKVYDNGKHDFRSPPNVQWFFMHLSPIIEKVSAAMDGDQFKESLALEVVGFNRWKDGCFGLACGASFIVNYTDRNGVDDKGWGFMFHVDNSYSFGVTKHGGDTGMFITVDLLKLFQDKKSAFNDYKKQYRANAN